MRELFSSSRFWILMTITIGAIVLAALGRVSGEQALTVLASLLGGFGVGKIPGGSNNSAKSLLPLLLLASLTSAGCGMDAAQRRAWVKVGTQAACAAGRMACEQYGGDQCSALVKMGCAITPDVIKVLVAKQAPPSSGEVSHEVARAYSSSPLRASMAPRIRPGFHAPTSAPTDSPPIKVQ